jgi:hypothetical protein
MFKNTAHDEQDRMKNHSKNNNVDAGIVSVNNPDKDLSKSIVKSLEVNVVSDLPVATGARYVHSH